eukprot:CAMPEP_0116871816 /NCGR_PEP_ID=MMETSP0463-20121206/2317_1 /TAXON_ID=181622 /ORGANISM="Strombidinopsis sp, Strain SopsisLIS2011" /LENGTH=98 /DNA_ID=CAMNT_0004510917 /DNA_START=395 /DNA_END=691 /DNA_ORIENTATION=+
MTKYTMKQKWTLKRTTNSLDLMLNELNVSDVMKNNPCRRLVKSAKLTFQNTSARFVIFLMTKLKRKVYSIVKSAEYAESAAEKTTSIVTHVDAVSAST